MAADVLERPGGKRSPVSDGISREFIGVRDRVTVWIKERFDVEGRERKGSRHTHTSSFISSTVNTQAHRDTCIVHFY